MDEETRARRDQCRTFLSGDGNVSPAELLTSIAEPVVPDTYGEGGVVAELESMVAELLGFQASVFLPSGTMAQAATLRVHALVGRTVGDQHRLLTLGDLETVAEPVAALLLELPQRDLGGQLPEWDELAAQIAWARDRGAAAHCDGARLWEASAGYGRPPAEIAALFDTAYVSFYKGIGALPGCCVAGSQDVVAQVREWRHRLGGTLHGLWPSAASAFHLLRERLAEMPGRLQHARAIAAALAGVNGVRVVPDPPQAPMMHLLFDVAPERFVANARRLADEQGVWVWPKPQTTGDPGVVRCELTVGRATCRLQPEQVAEVLQALCQ